MYVGNEKSFFRSGFVWLFIANIYNRPTFLLGARNRLNLILVTINYSLILKRLNISDHYSAFQEEFQVRGRFKPVEYDYRGCPWISFAHFPTVNNDFTTFRTDSSSGWLSFLHWSLVSCNINGWWMYYINGWFYDIDACYDHEVWYLSDCSFFWEDVCDILVETIFDDMWFVYAIENWRNECFFYLGV